MISQIHVHVKRKQAKNTLWKIKINRNKYINAKMNILYSTEI